MFYVLRSVSLIREMNLPRSWIDKLLSLREFSPKRCDRILCVLSVYLWVLESLQLRQNSVWRYKCGVLNEIVLYLFYRNKTLYDSIEGGVIHLKHEKWEKKCEELQYKFIFRVDRALSLIMVVYFLVVIINALFSVFCSKALSTFTHGRTNQTMMTTPGWSTGS